MRACDCVSSRHAGTGSVLLQKAGIAHTTTAVTGGRRMFNFKNPPVNESGPPCENSGIVGDWGRRSRRGPRV